MVNDNGREKLINRIVSDAKAEAEVTVSKAEKQAEAILTNAAKEIEKLIADAEKSGKEAGETVFDRVRTNAELDSRKLLLQKKREVLSSVFERAKSDFFALDKETLTAFYRNLIKNECEGTESICPSQNHRELVSAAVADVNGESGFKLSVTDDCRDIDGGFMVLAGGYEKDCSISSVFRALKEEEQTEVSKILFE